jgi:hypothetical protein
MLAAMAPAATGAPVPVECLHDCVTVILAYQVRELCEYRLICEWAKCHQKRTAPQAVHSATAAETVEPPKLPSPTQAQGYHTDPTGKWEVQCIVCVYSCHSPPCSPPV